MGGWRGGQAEYNLVPYADFNCLVLPKDDNNLWRNMLDCAMLSDSQACATQPLHAQWWLRCDAHHT